jgi:tetratricopeptide (TPR) repeat protein
LGKNTEAETHFLKAISLNPSNENARFYLGYLYISQNNKQKAQQMANELKSLNSKNAAPLQEKINKL